MKPLPPNLNEADLLDLIEGQPMSVSARAAVEAALAADPVLARLVRGMEADRSVLATLPKAHAPAGLFDAVEQRLTTDAIASVGAAERALRVEVPVSKFVPARRSVLESVLARPWAKPLALAAALGIAALGAWAFIAAQNWGPARGPLANRTIETNDEPAAPGAITRHAISRSGDPTPALKGPAADPALNAAVDVAAVRSDATIASAAEPARLGGMLVSEAMTLAREGRLAIVVRAAQAERVNARVAQLISRDSGSIRVRAATATEETQLAALAASWRERSAATTPGSTPLAPVHASESGHERAAAPESPAALVIPKVEPRVVGAYRAEMPPTEQALGRLIEALANGTAGQSVTLRALPPAEAAQVAPTRSPESILWWRALTSAGPRVWVPVVVEEP